MTTEDSAGYTANYVTNLCYIKKFILQFDRIDAIILVKQLL